ncbi:tetratricopeptide repeat protein [Pseudanabaena sp. PCC 6802]|uniref:tetratricopeptide repeat protein n=1 Tax=Pseudanabaena sp. PCC 6802 TaxID=118173 RepID=UPI00034C9FEE|nr:tetratricopeptide repeat protein [Pseudanabaena sp. PCC 6802]
MKDRRGKSWNYALLALQLGLILSLTFSFFVASAFAGAIAKVIAQEVPQEFTQVLAQATTRKASANQEGWQLYKAQKYEEAVVKFQQAVREKPDDPKPHWGLTLAFNQLKRYQEAKKSLDRAVKLDPNITFTNRQTYNKIRQTINKKIGQDRGTILQPPNPSPPPKQGTDLELIALKTDAVVVDASMSKLVDIAQLRQVANEAQPFTIEFIVKKSIPGDRLEYAKKIFTYLNLKNGAVIVATQRGVDVYSDRLTSDRAVELSKASRIEFAPDNYSPGLVVLARSVVAEVQRQEGQNKGLGFVALTCLAGGSAAFFIHRRYKWKERVTQLQELRYQVSTNLDDVDSYIKVLPQGDAASQASALYQQAVSEFVQASEIVDAPPKNLTQLERAESSLELARQHLQEARKWIDRSTGVTAPPSAPTIVERESEREEYVACFFTSQPLRISEAQTRTIDVDGVPQRVLCSPACAAQIDRGQIPNIRAVRQYNTYIPWYRYPDYNPYRDYYSYDREWIVVSYRDIQPEYRQSETIVITPDRSQYRDRNIQQIEQQIDWSAQANSAVSFNAGAESQSDTDFYSREDIGDASIDETPRETDFFFTGDRS